MFSFLASFTQHNYREIHPCCGMHSFHVNDIYLYEYNNYFYIYLLMNIGLFPGFFLYSYISLMKEIIFSQKLLILP